MGLRSETNEFQGGPGAGEPQYVDPKTVEQNQQQVPQQPKQQPIYLGGKVFNSVEELATYTSTLQTKIAAQEFIPQTIQEANKPKVSEMMFTDPESYTQIIKEDAVNEAVAIFDKRNAVQKLWSDFYDSHKDLAEHRDLVDFQYSKLKKDFANLPADQALVKVGSEVRAMLNRVQGSYQGGKELSTEPAIVAGASNGVAPTQTISQPVDNDSFITQVRKFQRRGK